MRAFSSELVGRAEEAIFLKRVLCAIDAASPFFHRVIPRLKCRENRWQRAPATGAAAGRARQSRGPRRRQNSSPGTARVPSVTLGNFFY